MPYATNDGLRIYYEVAGTGFPLALGHGWLGASARWREAGYVDALQSDYKLILIDALGHGQSDKPHASEAYSYQRMADDVLAVLDDLAIEHAHYWGYSMGGAVGYRLGRTAPHRITSLIIGGNHPFAMTSNENAQIDVMLADLRQGMDAFVAGWERRSGPLPVEVRSRWLANDGPALAASQEGQMPDDRAGLREPFSDLTMPCLLYGGTQEVFTAELRRAAEVLPNATIVLLDGLDHMQTFVQSDAVLPHVTAFLRRVTARLA